MTYSIHKTYLVLVVLGIVVVVVGGCGPSQRKLAGVHDRTGSIVIVNDVGLCEPSYGRSCGVFGNITEARASVASGAESSVQCMTNVINMCGDKNSDPGGVGIVAAIGFCGGVIGGVFEGIPRLFDPVKREDCGDMKERLSESGQKAGLNCMVAEEVRKQCSAKMAGGGAEVIESYSAFSGRRSKVTQDFYMQRHREGIGTVLKIDITDWGLKENNDNVNMSYFFINAKAVLIETGTMKSIYERKFKLIGACRVSSAWSDLEGGYLEGEMLRACENLGDRIYHEMLRRPMLAKEKIDGRMYVSR